MNSRERLTRLFAGREIDRIPIWLLAPYHKVEYYADIYNNQSYSEVVRYIERYCDTFDRRDYDFGFCCNGNPDIIKEHYKQYRAAGTGLDGNTVEEGVILRYKDFALNKYVSKGENGSKVKYFVEDIDDLSKILEIPYIPARPDVSSYEREKEELGDKGLMMTSIFDPLGVLYHLMSAEEFSISTITEYDKLIEFTDEIYKRTLDCYKYLLERNIGEVFFIIGAEFAGPPLVSPSMFNSLCSRYVKGLVELIKEYEKTSIVHYHGNLSRVLDGMREINMDGLHTIEAPPIGDCLISTARKALGNDMTLIGNIQYDDITRLGEEELRQMVHEAIDEGKSGRFILSPTAGPYEETISKKTSDNYLAFIRAGIEFGSLV